MRLPIFVVLGVSITFFFLNDSLILDGLKFLIANFLVAVLHNTIDDVYSLPAAAAPVYATGKRKSDNRGGSKTRRKKRPSKKRNMKTKRNNKNKQSNNKRSNAKKRNSKKLKKKNRKKRTTHRKK